MNPGSSGNGDAQLQRLLEESLDIQKSILRIMTHALLDDLNTQSAKIKLLAGDLKFSDTAIQAATGATLNNINMALKRAGMR